ncbi:MULTISPECIES: hypothetical protein [unclassified Bradyrhizobium]|uniref:hypothetical protein n=1 Tax=unclassified Bradyrhizobium TaxID=2631580 RepID=UPI0028E9AB1B|nr:MULTISPECIES: hypothetical protein [unclassified Bradyrhizobium]
MLRRPSAHPTSWALLACLGAAALILPVETASARSGGVVGVGPGARGAPVHVAPRVHGARGFRHHQRGFAYWPGAYAYGPYDGAPVTESAPPPPPQGPADVHYTYTEDVPWDWAHRFPPNVTPSDHPYVSSCPTETVKVPGRGGEQTVNIMRCY